VRREVAAWRYLSHPNVAEFLGIAYLLPGRPPGLVSRYMQRNDFLAYIGRHPKLKRDKVRSKYPCGGFYHPYIYLYNQAIEVSRGLQYLHSQNVVHGDLKAVR
jgi:serine/threonine protein kinase